jgi:hypothetical protein
MTSLTWRFSSFFRPLRFAKLGKTAGERQRAPKKDGLERKDGFFRRASSVTRGIASFSGRSKSGAGPPRAALRAAAKRLGDGAHGLPAAFFSSAATSSQSARHAACSSAGSLASMAASRMPARSVSFCHWLSVC